MSVDETKSPSATDQGPVGVSADGKSLNVVDPNNVPPLIVVVEKADGSKETVVLKPGTGKYAK